MKTLFYLFLALAVNIELVYSKANPKKQKQKATNKDFIKLKGKLQIYIAENPDRHIPLLVRTSFHDLFLQQKGALHGCLLGKDFLDHEENAGLNTTVKDLQTIVKKHFPSTVFTFGDVIAFAGKVAVETAYPCIKIPFRFNRSPCNTLVPNLFQPATSGFNNSISELQSTLDYLGGSITAEDMAILFAGAHGIKGARATGASGWRGLFSTFSSGKAFIQKTFSSTWTFLLANNEFKVKPQYITGGSFDNSSDSSTIMRLPSDMIFYPSKIPEGPSKDESPEVLRIQQELKNYTFRPRKYFDQAFAVAYAKMLAIGDGNKEFTDDQPIKECPDPLK